MRNAHFVLLAIVLSACSFVPRRSSEPPLQLTVQPSATISPVPSATSTPVTPTVSPTPTPDPRFFRDEFSGSLDAQWAWIREDSRTWNLTTLPGALQIAVTGGYVAAHNNSNLLLRSAPEGNFQIETQITFRPRQNFQFAGLIIYQNDSNFIQAGRSYCSAVGCVGAGLYMDYYEKGVVVKPNFGQRYGEIDPILLRLSRSGNAYTFEASTDGKVWFIIGSHTSEMNPQQIGLVTGQHLRGEILPAAFEYFEVRSLP
jgi:beta-xylosidase